MSPIEGKNRSDFCSSIFLKTVFFILFLFLWAIKTNAQQYRFDVVKGGKSIGEMVATKKINGDTIEYTLSSRTAIRIIFMLRINYDLNETYVKNALFKGDGLSTLNGTVQRQVETRRVDGQYEVENTSNIIKIEKDSIWYSVPELYFSEPKSDTTVFSQIFATYLEFEKIGEHTFLMHSDDGKNTYFYKNGICVEVEVNRPYATFSMILKQN